MFQCLPLSVRTKAALTDLLLLHFPVGRGPVVASMNRDLFLFSGVRVYAGHLHYNFGLRVSAFRGPLSH